MESHDYLDLPSPSQEKRYPKGFCSQPIVLTPPFPPLFVDRLLKTEVPILRIRGGLGCFPLGGEKKNVLGLWSLNGPNAFSYRECVRFSVRFNTVPSFLYLTVSDVKYSRPHR